MPEISLITALEENKKNWLSCDVNERDTDFKQRNICEATKITERLIFKTILHNLHVFYELNS